jgi:hypothetical protein
MNVGLILGVCGGDRGAAASCERCLRLRWPRLRFTVYEFVYIYIYIYIYIISNVIMDVTESWILVKTVLAAAVGFLPLKGFPRKNLCSCYQFFFFRVTWLLSEDLNTFPPNQLTISLRHASVFHFSSFTYHGEEIKKKLLKLYWNGNPWVYFDIVGTYISFFSFDRFQMHLAYSISH